MARDSKTKRYAEITSGTVEGFPAALADLTTAEVEQLQNIGATTISAAQWVFVGAANQAVKTTDSPTFVNPVATQISVDRLKLLERSTDPDAPGEGEAIIWMSDGTGAIKGDDGDVMIASTAGGVTKYATLFDHSVAGAW